jgi:hypothetical protein
MRAMTHDQRESFYNDFPHLMWCPDRRAEWVPWCNEHLGPEVNLNDPLTHSNRWIDAEDAVYIRLDEDAFAFKMRWG